MAFPGYCAVYRGGPLGEGEAQSSESSRQASLTFAALAGARRLPAIDLTGLDVLTRVER
jgi:hypothetical protein